MIDPILNNFLKAAKARLIVKMNLPDPFNGLISGTTLNQLSDSYGYNSFAEPEQYNVNSRLGPVFSQVFTRDKLGRITQKTAFNYRYDFAGRLETVRENNVLVASDGYDGNLNRTAKKTPSRTESGTYGLVVNANTGAIAQDLRYDEFGVVLEDTNPGFLPDDEPYNDD